MFYTSSMYQIYKYAKTTSKLRPYRFSLYANTSHTRSISSLTRHRDKIELLDCCLVFFLRGSSYSLFHNFFCLKWSCIIDHRLNNSVCFLF